MNDELFWDRINNLLNGNSLRWLSREVGLNQYSLQTAKNRNSIPKAETLQKISELYDVSVSWLLTGDESHDLVEVDPVLEEIQKNPKLLEIARCLPQLNADQISIIETLLRAMKIRVPSSERMEKTG